MRMCTHTCTIWRMFTWTHITMLQRPSSFLKMFFFSFLQIQYWRIVEEEEEEEEWRYRSRRKEENRETHSSLRGQRRKGCILRKCPNEKEYGSQAATLYGSALLSRRRETLSVINGLLFPLVIGRDFVWRNGRWIGASVDGLTGTPQVY